MELLDYDIVTGKHRSATEEWAPHKALSPKAFEWHYLSCPLTGSNGHTYFLILSAFNVSSEIHSRMFGDMPGGLPPGRLVYAVGTHFCDYDTQLFKHAAAPVLPTVDEVFDEDTNTLKFDGPLRVRFQYAGTDLALSASTPIYDLDLKMTGGDHVLWAKDRLGIPGFIREGAEDDRSFYYSLPKLPFHGTLQYQEADGSPVKTDVYGHAWVDRQWGDFLSNSWEWSSFRFADGDSINLYNFAGGYQVGSYMRADGSCEYFDSFTVIQNGYSKSDPPDNVWFSFGWSYRLPVKDGFYTVEPLSKKNFVVGFGNTLFEGLGRLLDASGKQVGWSINESMDVRVMNNAPYQEYQNF